MTLPHPRIYTDPTPSWLAKLLFALCRKQGFFCELDHVLRLKSLRPHWDRRHCGIAWPTFLVDSRTERRTSTPIWRLPVFWRKS